MIFLTHNFCLDAVEPNGILLSFCGAEPDDVEYNRRHIFANSKSFGSEVR